MSFLLTRLPEGWRSYRGGMKKAEKAIFTHAWQYTQKQMIKFGMWPPGDNLTDTSTYIGKIKGLIFITIK